MKAVIDKLARGKNLTVEETETAIRDIMTGQTEPAVIAAFLTALAIKGETREEIAAAARVMRSLALQVELPADLADVVVDPVGTGGDGEKLVNISTASAIVAAAGGVKIAKHGNVAASSASGSADFLRESGCKFATSPTQIVASLQTCGFGFMHAQKFHSAMRFVAPVRKSIGIRTIFNILGPLTNPASVKRQVLGVFDRRWLNIFAEVCRDLGSKKVIVVHSENGLDEFSVTHKNFVCELQENGEIREYCINPKDFGFNYSDHRALQINSSVESVKLIREIWTTGKPEIGFDMLSLNAAAIFVASGLVEDFAAGIAKAKEIMTSGAASKQLENIAAVTSSFGE
ncbi:MAG: anthranilate phosphoribosyltransferase [Cardiobacteriaceae bacterium]|nr:anthranilate phosphoribosyltransferase [Cardiobacteriaceae bacterium]